MGRNSHYFIKCEENARKAQEHTQVMSQQYAKEIQTALEATKAYGGPDAIAAPPAGTRDASIILVAPKDSVQAIFDTVRPNQKTAVLNFASYLNPGGKFFEGSSAQEESLCHESFLYNVISQCNGFYTWNALHRNNGMYTNRALYTPNVLFFRKNQVTCDVITCACPNWSVGERYGRFSKQENTEACRDRIRFLLAVAGENSVDNLILGAFGCGVFAQDATEMARLFRAELDGSYKGLFRNVVFAIPDDPRNNNFRIFRDVFGA